MKNMDLIAALQRIITAKQEWTKDELVEWIVQYNESHDFLYGNLGGIVESFEAHFGHCRLKKPTVLYKGLSGFDYAPEMMKTNVLKIGQKVPALSHKDAPMNSWTKAQKAAGWFMEPSGFMIKATFKPGESVIDFDCLPEDVLGRLKNPGEHEVLVRTDIDVQAEIVEIVDGGKKVKEVDLKDGK